MTPQRIRKLIEKTRPSRATLGFPKSTQRTVAAYATKMIAAGKSRETTAKMLGVSDSSLERWMKTTEKPKQTKKETPPTGGLYAISNSKGVLLSAHASIEAALTAASQHQSGDVKVWKEIEIEFTRVAKVKE